MARLDMCRHLWLKSVVLVLTVVFFQSVPVSAGVELSSDAGTEVCSRTEVTFTCTASTPGVRWRYSGTPAPIVVDFTSTVLPLLGPFTLEVITGDSTFLISTATAAITEGVNGSLSCEEQFNFTANDSTTIPGIKAPPSFVPNLIVPESTIMRVGANQWEFNLKWNSADCNFEYVITVDPPLPSLPSDNCTEDCTIQCRTFTLGRDDPRNFTVIAQNCGGTQMGNASEPLTVCLELPDVPMVSATLTYGEVNMSNPDVLQSIQLTWPSVPDPEDPVPGVDGSIIGYQISVTGMPPINVTKDQLCTNVECSYEVDVSSDSSSDYSVSVAARNILGLGANISVGPYSAVNDYIFVENDTNCSLIVNCTSFTSYTISVTQGQVTQGETQTTTTDMLCATGSNSTTVLADPEVSSTTYDYQVQVESGADTVIVMGSFEGSCSPRPIPIPRSDCDDLDLEDEEIALIVVGVLSFVGAVVLFGAAIVVHWKCYKRILQKKDCHALQHVLWNGFAVLLHLASFSLWIATTVKWSTDDCREDVHKQLIQGSSGLSIGSFLWHIGWFLLPYIFRDCFRKCWHKYCCKCCQEKCTSPGEDTTDGSKNKPDKMEMEEHYGHLQHNMGSPTSSAVPTPDPTYGQLNADDADESTGQQEYQQLRHGTQPHAVPNPEQPGYSHLGQPPPEGDQYAEVPKNDRRKWW